MMRILVDFNTAMQGEGGKVIIYSRNYDTSEWHDGMRVVVFEPDDIEAEAVLEFHDGIQHWLGIVDWSTLRHI